VRPLRGESPGLHGAACKVSEAKAEEGWGHQGAQHRREALTAPGAKPLSAFEKGALRGNPPLERVAERREAAEARGRRSPATMNTS